MKRSLILCLLFVGCDKMKLPLESVKGTPFIQRTVIGAGQSNMANMNLEDFQASANGVTLVENIAVGGSSLDQWTQGTTYNNNLVYDIQHSPYPIGAILWWQGEAEALSGQGYLTWQTRFMALVGQIRALPGQSRLMFIVVRLGPSMPGCETAWDSVRDQQWSLGMPNVKVIDIDDIPRTNGVHYGTTEYKQIAQRLASVYSNN